MNSFYEVGEGGEGEVDEEDALTSETLGAPWADPFSCLWALCIEAKLCGVRCTYESKTQLCTSLVKEEDLHGAVL